MPAATDARTRVDRACRRASRSSAATPSSALKSMLPNASRITWGSAQIDDACTTPVAVSTKAMTGLLAEASTAAATPAADAFGSMTVQAGHAAP